MLTTRTVPPASPFNVTVIYDDDGTERKEVRVIKVGSAFNGVIGFMSGIQASLRKFPKEAYDGLIRWGAEKLLEAVPDGKTAARNWRGRFQGESGFGPEVWTAIHKAIVGQAAAVAEKVIESDYETEFMEAEESKADGKTKGEDGKGGKKIVKSVRPKRRGNGRRRREAPKAAVAEPATAEAKPGSAKAKPVMKRKADFAKQLAWHLTQVQYAYLVYEALQKNASAEEKADDPVADLLDWDHLIEGDAKTAVGADDEVDVDVDGEEEDGEVDA